MRHYAERGITVIPAKAGIYGGAKLEKFNKTVRAFAYNHFSEKMSQSSRRLAKHRIACFISPHGFGHAARAAGIMAAIHEIESSIRFEIFTKVPSWFFQDSLSGPFTYHSLLTDIGLMQKTPLREDLGKTLQCLNDFLPFDHSQISSLGQLINRLKCELIICDIAPMGILVAREADIPSVLVENFTWDWIYQKYKSYGVEISKHIEYLRSLFDAADHHIQTEPVCCYRMADLTTLPVSRKVRTPAREIRKRLRLPCDRKVVMITMGGIPEHYSFLKELANQREVHFVIPGGSQSMEIRDNLVLLPHHSDFFHPDLINACDAVVGKLGYGTLAEVYHTGVPFGYISRPSFRESEILAAYVEREMIGVAIEETEFQAGSWISHLQDLLALPRIQRSGPNGAEQVARFIHTLLNGEN